MPCANLISALVRGTDYVRRGELAHFALTERMPSITRKRFLIAPYHFEWSKDFSVLNLPLVHKMVTIEYCYTSRWLKGFRRLEGWNWSSNLIHFPIVQIASLSVTKPLQLILPAIVLSSPTSEKCRSLAIMPNSVITHHHPPSLRVRTHCLYSILIFFDSFATAFGTTTVKIPSFKLAFTPSWSTLPGKVKLRWNSPMLRSVTQYLC